MNGPLWLACGLTVAVGCDDHVIGHGAPIGINCLRDPPLTWENTGDGLLGRQCRPCHSSFVRQAQRAGAPPGMDFDTWDDTLFWADRMMAAAVESEVMPPAGGMTLAERQKFEEWMRCEVLPALGEVQLTGTNAEAVP